MVWSGEGKIECCGEEGLDEKGLLLRLEQARMSSINSTWSKSGVNKTQSNPTQLNPTQPSSHAIELSLLPSEAPMRLQVLSWPTEDDNAPSLSWAPAVTQFIQQA